MKKSEQQKSKQIKKQIKEHEGEIAAIQLKVKGLRVEFIAALNSESEFEIGEKVEVFKQNYGDRLKHIGEGFFAGYVFDIFGDPYPRLFKAKKDGTASKKEFLKFDFSTIQKIAK